MLVIDLHASGVPKPVRLRRPPVCEAVETERARKDCPYRAICKSPICRGDWSNPDCPGSSKGK
jgi:hypothetical protein